MIRNLPPRLNRSLAELEFDLWESLVAREIVAPCEFSFGFNVRREGVGRDPTEESVEVTVSIRKI